MTEYLVRVSFESDGMSADELRDLRERISNRDFYDFDLTTVVEKKSVTKADMPEFIVGIRYKQ